MGIYERIHLLCQERNITIGKFCADCGVSAGNLGDLKAGRRKSFSAATALRIANYFGVSVEYLLGKTDERTAPSEVSSVSDVTYLPLYNSVSAGFGAYAADYAVGKIATVLRDGEDPKHCLAIRVSGNSMATRIEDGDVVIVHKQDSVDSGTVAVVLLDGDAGLIKKVNYGSDWIELVSFNPAYSPMMFKGADVLRLRVVGRVKQVIKTL